MKKLPITVFLFSFLLIFSNLFAQTNHIVETTASLTFSPADITIMVGDTVTWMNTSLGFHNVVADDGSFTSGAPSNSNWTYSYVFASAGSNPYHCAIHGGPGGVGMSGTVTVQSSTPVELTSFSAIVKDKSVLLNWETATETNNKGFQIEKSLLVNNIDENIQSNLNWKVIKFIQGIGTSSEKHQYTFQDKNITSGKYQYRLKQIDFDGHFNYSKVASIYIKPVDYILSQNYPNPFNPSTTINFTIPQSGFTQLKVYASDGSEVASLVSKNLNAGTYNISFNAKNLASGVYFYRLKSGNFNSIKKLMLLK